MLRGTHEAVCFDLDGTLVDSEPLHVKAEREMLVALGISELSNAHPRTFGMDLQPGMTAIAELYGIDEDAVLCTYEKEWNRLVETDLALMPGADQALRRFRDAGIPTALVTSADAAYAQRMTSKFDLSRFFRCIVTADDVDRLKPAPEPYLTAAQRLGAQPERTVAFEDSEAGVKSVVQAGMYCIAVHANVDHRTEFGSAHMRLKSLEHFDGSRMISLFGDPGTSN